MSIKITFDGSDRRAIRWDLRDTWSLDEFEQSLTQSLKLIQQSSKPTYMILNSIQPSPWPPHFTNYLLSKRVEDRKFGGFIVVWRANILTRLFLNQLASIKQPLPCYFVASLEAAYDVLTNEISHAPHRVPELTGIRVSQNVQRRRNANWRKIP